MFPYAYMVFLILAALLFVDCGKKGNGPDVVFSFDVHEDSATGWHVVRLDAGLTDDPRKSISIRVAPEGGNNMFSFRVGEHELIDAEDDIGELINQGRGTPILYPTPNRIRDATYVFMGDTLKMSFPGETRSHMLHGLVKDDTAWQFSEPEVRDDAVVLKTWYVFDESNPRFPAYPFKNTLRVEYALMRDRVLIRYEVENQDTKPLGFGFGLHPFWKVIGAKEQCFIQAALPYHMTATKDILPTGEIEPVEGTDWSLIEPKPLAELHLDDVYYGATPETAVGVFYEAVGLRIQQRATADFTHVVVYTPDRDYFCVENQTCSTDTHNLYARGLTEESHLRIVEPGAKTGGHVEYIITREK